jgi:DNA-binding IclR family transcriptional regulator
LQIIDRVATILESISIFVEGVGIAELHRSSNLPKSTLHRILTGLMKHGYVMQNDDSKKYRLGPNFLILGANYLYQNDLRKIAAPYLKKLGQELCETVFLAIFQNELAICIDTYEVSRNNVTYFVRQGRVMPFNCTAAAKILLAYQKEEVIKKLVVPKNMVKNTEKSIIDPNLFIEHLKEIKEKGYSICKEEMEEGVMAIAAPIWDIKSRVIGSVAVLGSINRISSLERDFVKKIKKTAYLISCELGCNPEKFKMHSIF